MRFQTDALFASMESSTKLRGWIHENYNSLEENVRETEMLWERGLPLARVGRLNYLLESGFSPKRSKHVVELVHHVVRKGLRPLKEKLAVRISRSTTAWAVADPFGVLRPGGVHLAFSSCFLDGRSGFCESRLDRIEVLLSRQPAFRSSDIQKARAVYKCELSHLRDVIIFPSRGRFPLAEVMQNGDYDGDRFRICWEPSIVQPFRNAPPPVNPPLPEELGIKVDDTRVKDIFSDRGGGMQGFLQRAFSFRCTENMPGICAMFHERLSYMENSLSTPSVQLVAALREHLLDSTKNGYVFPESAWLEFVRTSPSICNKSPKLTAHEQANAMDNVSPKVLGCGSDHTHIVDYLKFHVVEPYARGLRESLGRLLNEARTEDEVLTDTWDRYSAEVHNNSDRVLQAELDCLLTGLNAVHSR